ncbi:hypothetical protein BG261_01065 [Floricoccus tropicus]|uniref:DinB-like domain-containing protein n=1 Tax=Floricoccus tropicus TaxID=1859473 RepID=A0A1E8GSQ9_9LACT|nr:DUF664 domain-containing protein [Floricoccus tropicus]OFI50498.1 hypothetical protein BG261_01065 [Floricoccus tropicus]
MEYLDMIVEAVERGHERFLSVLEGLTVEQVNDFPAKNIAPSIKSVAWLSWHTAREMDYQISELKGTNPLWLVNGWKEKFNLDLPDDTEDWHHTPEQAAKVKVSDVDLLRGYLEDAANLTKEYLKTINENELDDIVDKNWNPPVSRGARLVSVIDDLAMHSGQVIYSRRLLGLDD